MLPFWQGRRGHSPWAGCPLPPSHLLPSAVKPSPPLGYRPCRHNHRIATLGSHKLALIYKKPWDGLRLSVHQSVSVSCLDRAQATLDLSYRLRRSKPRFVIGMEASRGPPLLFDQLIDLLTLAAGRVSLNLISEFISGGRVCTEMM